MKMAKQNFLGGGYIGKLGQTVGQRWKDQKIVRTYVKPANPNTPAQQNARAMFATANKLAQQAMNINGHTGVWDTSTCPEYSQRVGQAMRRLRAGYTEQQSLPLYPEGSLPEINTTLQNYVYDQQAQTVTFTVNDYGISEPTAVEISFYSPLAFLNGKYTEHIIHGTADHANKTFTIDISNNNTTDDATVRNDFIEYLEFGFLSMYPTFYDMLGAPLPEIRLSRGYALNNTLYDFNKDLALIETQGKVTFTQAVQNDSITASVLPPVDANYPYIFRGQSVNTYWQNKAGNTSEAGLGTITSATGATIQLDATPTAVYLKSTNSEFYYLQSGGAGKQMYKDVSTAQYDNPIKTATMTNIEFAADSNQLLITFDHPEYLDGIHTIKYDARYINSAYANLDFTTESGTLTKEADGRYKTSTSFSNRPNNILYLYFYIYAVNADNTGNDSVELPLADIVNDKIVTVMEAPKKMAYDFVVSKCPIDLARTNGISFTPKYMVGAGNELFLNVIYTKQDNTTSAPHNFKFTTAENHPVEKLTSTTVVTTDTVKNTNFYVVEPYTENGQRKVAFQRLQRKTETDIIGTTAWTTANMANMSISFGADVAEWASSGSGEIYQTFDGEWGQFGFLNQANIATDGNVTFPIDWDGSETQHPEAFICEPQITLKDKNGTDITGLYVSARQANENGTIYVNSKLSETRVTLTGAYYMASDANSITVRFTPANQFSGNVRVSTGTEITDADNDITLGEITGSTPAIVNASTLKITCNVYDNSTANTPLYETPPIIITGTGYNTKVCTWY